MLTRLTYLVDSEVYTIPDHLEDFKARKHIVRTWEIAPTNLSASVEFSNSHLDMPFDPPMYTGLRAFANNITASNLLFQHFGLDLGPPLTSGDFLTWSNTTEPSMRVQAGLDLKSATSWRITLDSPTPNTSQISLELFYDEQQWTEPVFPPAMAVSEVGIFQPDFVGDSYILTGKSQIRNRKEKPVSFLWAKRDYNTDLTVDSTFTEPYGLHPHLELNLTSQSHHPMCKLYVLLNLPQDMILDEYELMDHKQLQLMDIWGQKDLENPEWAENEGVSALFRLNGLQNYSIPTHFRYKLPGNLTSSEIPRIECFYVCRTEDPVTRELRPHEKIGIPQIFPPNSMFLHSQTSPVNYTVPRIQVEAEQPVIYLTQAAVITGFLMVLATIFYKLRAAK